ncbi:MAG: hypothetical protein K9N09_08870 [Candidatus Cloacimonetes bacterium]|nr:hypothetical protein [Candidatus Cloacimonadota bacterium]MCF7814448.1 hypothetical protein [Candidatus Cloacimonadota bacterium]MCF7868798.1 hypothetical protein [Candidatus Cloacimonadota bacterium]
MKKIILMIVMIMLISGLSAIPYTAMGNVNIPDAYCLPHLMMEFSYVNHFTENETYPGATGPYDEYDYAGVYRIGLFNRADIGFVYTSTAGFLANIKLKVTDETEVFPGFAIGCLNMFSEVSDSGDQSTSSAYEYPDGINYVKFSPFGVMSKSFIMVTGMNSMQYLEARFHLGMGARRFRGRGEISHYFTGIFMGAEIKPAKWLSFGGELDGQNVSLNLNLHISNLTLNFAIYKFEDLIRSSNRNNYAINVSYTMDALSEIKASDRKRQVPLSSYSKTRSYSGDGEGESLESELEKIRERRKQAEKELEEIRKLLQEQE